MQFKQKKVEVDSKRMIKAMSNCTFHPKISKYDKPLNRNYQLHHSKGRIDYDHNTLDFEKQKEFCTFKPLVTNAKKQKYLDPEKQLNKKGILMIKVEIDKIGEVYLNITDRISAPREVSEFCLNFGFNAERKTKLEAIVYQQLARVEKEEKTPQEINKAIWIN